MSRRIRIGCRVSTEAWRFDNVGPGDSDRWSFKQFGDTWRDARVFGIVVDRVGEKLLVLWDLDEEISLFETSILTKEEDRQESETSEPSKPDSSQITENSRIPDHDDVMSPSDDENSDQDGSIIDERIAKPDPLKEQEHDRLTGIFSSSEESGDEGQSKLMSIEEVRKQNIKENNRMLQQLGFSKRKFDRHVPNVSKSKYKNKGKDSEHDIDMDNNYEEETNKELIHGEEVHLLWEEKEIFKATFDGKDTEYVHGVATKEGEGRFFITKILRGASKWDGFDIEKTCIGAAILWNKGNSKRRHVLTEVQQLGTEAKQPTPLENPKRKREPENWRVNKRKNAVNNGQEYTYQQKTRDGKMLTKIVKKREIKPPCSEKCRMKCREKFSEEIRLQIFHQFYESGDKAIQSQQLCSLVTEHKTSRKRCEDEENSRRFFSREYYLMKKGEKVRVCSTMFLNTFAIDEKRVRTLLKNKTETGTPLPDGRGRYPNHRREEKRINYVKEHIMSFQVVESHYVRSDTKNEYLPCELSVSEMYRMYQKWAEEKNYPCETYSFYARVFRERFNIKFQKPKKDKCDTCEAFSNNPNPSKEDQVAKENHLKDKDYVRHIKQSAKDSAARNVTKCAAAFDLQKVLLTPYGQTSSFYYSKRLTNFNFTVTELDSMSTWCYFWSEYECQKGSCEVATSLLKYILERKEAGITDFHLFSDRCGGQNNNRMVFVMLSHALNTCQLDSIRLTYLVSGHSQSENDNAHSVIEQMARKRTLYTPTEWESLIQCAFKKNRCALKVLEHGDIINFKSSTAFPEYASVYADKTAEILTTQQLEQQISLNHTLGLEKRKPEKVYWSEIVDILFSKNEPEILKFKYNYNEDYRSANFFTPKRELRPKEQKERDQDMKKYLKPCGITAVKKADLLKLCSKNFIPHRHHRFYEELPTNNSIKE